MKDGAEFILYALSCILLCTYTFSPVRIYLIYEIETEINCLTYCDCVL